MATTDRLFQDFISFVTDTDPGVGGLSLSAPGLAALLVVADPDFVALTLDPEAVNGDPEIVWVSAHSSSATTATIVRGQEGTTPRAHPIGTQVVLGPTADTLEEIETDVATNVTNVATNVTNIATNTASFVDRPVSAATSLRRQSGFQTVADATWEAFDLDQVFYEDDPGGVLTHNLSDAYITVAANSEGIYLASLEMVLNGTGPTDIRVGFSLFTQTSPNVSVFRHPDPDVAVVEEFAFHWTFVNLYASEVRVQPWIYMAASSGRQLAPGTHFTLVRLSS